MHPAGCWGCSRQHDEGVARVPEIDRRPTARTGGGHADRRGGGLFISRIRLGVKAFEYRRVKNDQRDAADPADLLRMGRLPQAWIAPPATRELRELVRHRAKLVALRANCTTRPVPGAGGLAAPGRRRGRVRDRGCSPRSPARGWPLTRATGRRPREPQQPVGAGRAGRDPLHARSPLLIDPAHRAGPTASCRPRTGAAAKE